MSDSVSKPPPGFLWLVTALLGFAAMTVVLSAMFSGQRTYPRDETRAASTATIKEAQHKNLEKMGLVPGKSTAALTKGASLVHADKPTISKMLVPGSPTQLKEAAKTAPPAAAAPAAPSSAAKPAASPATPTAQPPAAPATQPTTPAAPSPSPAAPAPTSQPPAAAAPAASPAAPAPAPAK